MRGSISQMLYESERLKCVDVYVEQCMKVKSMKEDVEHCLRVK